jgi:hypothetical protein
MVLSRPLVPSGHALRLRYAEFDTKPAKAKTEVSVAFLEILRILLDSAYFLRSTGSMATRIRTCGVICSIASVAHESADQSRQLGCGDGFQIQAQFPSLCRFHLHQATGHP